jgi:hypothetical protein
MNISDISTKLNHNMTSQVTNMRLHPKEIDFTTEDVRIYINDALVRGKQYVDALVDQLQRQEKDNLVTAVREAYHQNQKVKKNV